jgi:hypothetical protein
MFITKRQLALMSASMRVRFEKSTVTFLSNKFPVSTKNKTEKDLLILIKDGINKSANYRIVERSDVMAYLEFMVCLGEDFDSNPTHRRLKKILNVINFKGAEKIARLQQIHPIKPEFI